MTKKVDRGIKPRKTVQKWAWLGNFKLNVRRHLFAERLNHDRSRSASRSDDVVVAVFTLTMLGMTVHLHPLLVR